MDRFKGEFGKIEGGIFEGGLIPIVSYIQNTATCFFISCCFTSAFISADISFFQLLLVKAPLYYNHVYVV